MAIAPFSTAYLLGASVVLLLGAKLVATLILLTKGRESWFSSRWSEFLWWVSKITPVIAAACFLGLGIELHNKGFVIAALLVFAFAVVAVPIKARRAYEGKTPQPHARPD